MKQRIISKDIEMLTDKQKQNLNALWIPGIYDVAVANICKNIENEEYEKYEFVVGGIQLFNGYRILLHDIKALYDEPVSEENESDNSSEQDSAQYDDETDDFEGDEDSSEDDYEEEQEDEAEEIDPDYNYTRPTSFIKDECIPLLSIGQMIDILQKNNFGKSSFHLAVYTDEKFCEIGKDDISIDNFEKGFEEEPELCNVLWDAVKSLI